MSFHRVAVVQAGPVPFDRPRTLAKARSLVAEAAAQGAELVVFPEAFLTAYPKGLDFGARVGMRSPEGRREFRRYFESAIDVPGPETESLAAAARKHGVYLVIGAIEREIGTLYCTALFFGPEGRLLAKHRKLMPTAMERLVWGFGDGSTLPVLDTPLGRIGAVICWENYMPLLRAAMYAKGIQLYCAPTVDDRDTWIPTMQHIALEGRCFVLSACQFIRRGDYPADYPAIQGDAPETVLIRGGSVIVNPMGRILARPNYEGECIQVADLDLGEIAEGKYDLDVAGHYARPDVFRLLVNERPAPVASFGADEADDLRSTLESREQNT
ncbi:MAG TPA: nitrilase-related carbon-nitrogen hydrolase [Bryobacteraceae bacterium]|nr:nitrilase-related carbon-nitrogen hydrolase [Bryobacteraceae bacterium]